MGEVMPKKSVQWYLNEALSKTSDANLSRGGADIRRQIFEYFQKETAKRPTPKQRSTPLLQTLVEAVSPHYPQDAWCAGVTVAKLKDGSYYASVRRWPHGARDSFVVSKHGGATFDEAVHGVAVEWFRSVSPKPLQSFLDKLEEVLEQK
jgi:hypothetical protein